MTFAVLLVCTGNLCRSVAAEHLLRAALPAEGFELMSAGTHAEDGRPAHPLTLQALEMAGLDGVSHRAQRLVPSAVSVADLVLTATRAHRLAVVDADPTAVPRTFTMHEFSRLLASQPSPWTSAHEAVRAAAAGRAGAASTAADDLEDPVRGDLSDHRRMVESVAVVAAQFARALGALTDQPRYA